jgi:hypothetical protein
MLLRCKSSGLWLPGSQSRFVCAKSGEAAGDRIPRLFRTYAISGSSGDVRIWEAARATTAATTLFKPIDIKMGGITEEFSDASIGCNNPAEEAMKEIQYHLTQITPKINCVVSIGTGSPPKASLAKSSSDRLLFLQRQNASNSSQVHQSMAARFRDKPGTYFRYDVPQGMENIWVGEWELMGRVKEHTMRYINDVVIQDDITRAKALLSKKLLVHAAPVTVSPPASRTNTTGATDLGT